MPRETLKLAFVAGVLTDGQVWIDMLNARNEKAEDFNPSHINHLAKLSASTFFEALSQGANTLQEKRSANTLLAQG